MHYRCLSKKQTFLKKEKRVLYTIGRCEIKLPFNNNIQPFLNGFSDKTFHAFISTPAHCLNGNKLHLCK